LKRLYHIDVYAAYRIVQDELLSISVTDSNSRPCAAFSTSSAT
jgi:hypothetical protein